jgi:hypothetical protein
MKNQPQSRNHDRDNPDEDPSQRKEIRGLASLGHAFFNQYKADNTEEKENKRIERVWTKRGARASIAYTLITAVIMVFAITQTWISRNSEVCQLRAYVGPVPQSFQIHCSQCGGVLPDPTVWECHIAGFENCITYTVKNYGATPAYRSVICGDLFPVPIDSSPRQAMDQTYNGCERRGLRVTPTLYPGEERQEALGITFVGKIGEVFQHHATGLLVIVILYRDVFGNVRHTYICRRYVPLSVSYSPGMNGFSNCGSLPIPRDD